MYNRLLGLRGNLYFVGKELSCIYREEYWITVASVSSISGMLFMTMSCSTRPLCHYTNISSHGLVAYNYYSITLCVIAYTIHQRECLISTRCAFVRTCKKRQIRYVFEVSQRYKSYKSILASTDYKPSVIRAV